MSVAHHDGAMWPPSPHTADAVRNVLQHNVDQCVEASDGARSDRLLYFRGTRSKADDKRKDNNARVALGIVAECFSDAFVKVWGKEKYLGSKLLGQLALHPDFSEMFNPDHPDSLWQLPDKLEQGEAERILQLHGWEPLINLNWSVGFYWDEEYDYTDLEQSGARQHFLDQCDALAVGMLSSIKGRGH